MPFAPDTLSVHTNCGLAEGLILFLCGPTIIAWLPLLPSLSEPGKEQYSVLEVSGSSQSLPAHLTPESSSDGYSNSSFGDGQLAGAWRHMATSSLPKKPSPCARDVANRRWLSGRPSHGMINEHPAALLLVWGPAALSELLGITVSGTQKRREFDQLIGET